MASKSRIKQKAKRLRVEVKPEHKPGHPHCEPCGGCLFGGVPHRCETGLDPEVYAVFEMDQQPKFILSRRRDYAAEVAEFYSNGFSVTTRP